MYRYLTAFLFFGFALYSRAFSQTTVEKYCVIETYNKNGFTSRISIRIVTGNVDTLFSFRDSTVISGLSPINSLTTIPDALNFMGSKGWKLIAATTLAPSLHQTQFYFKKEFDMADLK